jgi:hypothetical protein
MMKRKYCCDASKSLYEEYYVNQAGNGMPVFQGSRGQRGHGFGSVLGGLFRSAMPMLKRIGKQGLITAASIASDVLGGKNFGDAARSRVRDGINTFLEPEQFSEQTGGGRRRTYKRKTYRTKLPTKKRQKSNSSSRKRKGSVATRKTKRRKNNDIFA